MRAYLLKCLAATLLALAVVSLQTQSVHAQAAQPEGDKIKGDIAGTVGLGLLGAEVGLFLPPAFNLQDHWWAWVLFPAVTAAGGAVAGVFVFEPRDPKPTVTVSILGAGMLLAVPMVVSASALATARRRKDMERVESGGLLRFSRRGAEFGAPAVTTTQIFSPAEQARFGLPQRTSTRVALVSGRF